MLYLVRIENLHLAGYVFHCTCSEVIKTFSFVLFQTATLVCLLYTAQIVFDCFETNGMSMLDPLCTCTCNTFSLSGRVTG